MYEVVILLQLGFADLSFLAVADWGGLPIYPWVTPAQRRVAAAMAKVSRRHRSAFVLSLGDHFYFHGVRSANDARFRRTFERVYHQASLQGAGFWRCVAGNHDHAGNVTAQLAYAAAKHSRWHFPSLQYRWRQELGDEERTSVEFVLIDTVELCGMPRRKPSRARAEERWRWVERALRAAENASYLVVGGHYPVHSPSSHGPTACLRKRLVPLLEASRATLYLSGHDHSLFHVGARATTAPHPPQYHGVGAGFGARRTARHASSLPRNTPLRFHYQRLRSGRRLARFDMMHGGFAGVSVSGTGLTVTHYDSEAQLLHRATVPPRPAPEPQPSVSAVDECSAKPPPEP